MMCGFACMYFQDPSLLQFQQQLQEAQHRDNLQTLFEVEQISEATQMRDLIDAVDSEEMRPMFTDYFSRLQRSKCLPPFQLFPKLYYCAIDGTQYYHSNNISCPHCLKANHASGTTSYSHKVLQAAILHPDLRQVIPLMPEEIKNTDGTAKQDCELNAAKRLIPKLRQDHPHLRLIIGGDDIYSHQPFITLLRDNGMHYFLVAKPSDHQSMMDFIAQHALQMQQLRRSDEHHRLHVYEWIHNVPLNGSKDAIHTNFVKYRILSIDAQGQEKVHYANSWVTDLTLSADNVETLVRGGRCRWKVENECFNTLKNQGYHLEHNFGHGQRHLSFNFYLFTLLAFFCHQIFELTDRFYQACRRKFGSKRHLWETLRSYIKIFVFDSWELLLDFALSPRRYVDPWSLIPRHPP